MGKTEIDRIIQKSLSQPLTENEKATLLTWLEENDENKHLYASIRDLQALITAQSFRTIKRSRRSNRWWGIAAACIGVSLAVWGLYTLSAEKDSQLVATARTEKEVILISANRTYTISTDTTTEKVMEQQQLLKTLPDANQELNRLIVPQGKIFSIRLCDGTVVHLNSMSELSFPSEFTGNQREVTLKGEAFFDVTHDAAHPFILSTEHSVIRVLGTRFNVSAYTNDQQETISLVEGCVETKATDQQIKLMPGEQVVVTTGSQEMKKSNFNPEEVMSWMDGFFFFEDQPLNVVLKAVARWYQVDFEFASEELKEIDIYIRIRKEKPIEDLFRALEATQKISFRQEGKKIVVKQVQQ